MSHHSTSDDSFAYRPRSEVEDRKRIDNPISRFKSYLESRGWWNEAEEEELKARLKKQVMDAFKKAEVLKRPELGELFSDVYGGEEPWNIVSSFLKFPFPYRQKGWLLMLSPIEGTTERAWCAVGEVWRVLGAMAERARHVQRQGQESPQVKISLGYLACHYFEWIITINIKLNTIHIMWNLAL